MKKSLVLGAAALAAVMMAAPQSSDAGEIKVGGYYMFRMIDSDSSVAEEGAGVDEIRRWAHRLAVNTDFIHDAKTHAHTKMRIMDSQTVEGANLKQIDSPAWRVSSAWLETEAWGVGLKVGNMPVSLNDNILVSTNSTDGSSGALMLSKTFGDITMVLADVRVAEGNPSGRSANDQARYDAAYAVEYAAAYAARQDIAPVYASPGAAAAVAAEIAKAKASSKVADTAAKLAGDAAVLNQGADEDDQDLYVLSMFGKFDQIDYNVTGAYLQTGDDAARAGAAAGTDNSNGWLAATVHGGAGGVDVTGTVIYEAGWDGSTAGSQYEEDDFMVALRLKGKTSIGGWNAYGFWAGEDFDNIINNEMKWSATWDSGGPGAQDLLKNWAKSTKANSANDKTASENMAGIGAGMEIKVDNWTIKPMLDYATVVEDDIDGDGLSNGITSDAWGGTLAISTPINKATTLSLTGVFVDPNDENNTEAGGIAAGTDNDIMHYVEASVKMKF